LAEEKGAAENLYKRVGRIYILNFFTMKKIESLGRALSKNEQKSVLGGKAAPCTCNCEGGTGGSWFYNYEPSAGTIAGDISDYCSTGVGACTGCSNL
jgi:hypothetical protein